MIQISQRTEDITGQKFHYLTVQFPVLKRGRTYIWQCICDCGNISRAASSALKCGHTKSCGCIRSDITKKANTTHGLRSHPLYVIWYSMLRRCNNSDHSNFDRYGGRGIYVCDSWFNLENFIRDIGARPSLEYSLERIDNDGPYCKENCRWATREEQGNNRHNTIYLEYNNQRKTLKEWSEITGFSLALLRSRKCKKWTDYQILSTPKGKSPNVLPKVY